MRRIKSKSLSSEVRDEIFDYIQSSFKNGMTKLPTEEQFAKMLGVSRITIRTALNDLAAMGIIFRLQGKGTFVNSEAISMKVQFNPVSLFSEMITQCGYSPSVKVLPHEEGIADSRIGNMLQVEAGSRLIIARKIFYADGNPCAYCQDYFDAGILKQEFAVDIINDYPNTLFDFFEINCGRKIVWDKVEILTVTNTEEPSLSSYFDCGDSIKSFLLLDCVNYDKDNLPVVYAKEYVDTNYIRFNSIRQKIHRSGTEQRI